MLRLRADDRIAILGASGWFGSTLGAMLEQGIPILRTASQTDDVNMEWEWATLRDFSPTVVVNFAFLTRERVETEGLERFDATNRKLIEQFVRTSELPRVRACMTASSGAVVSEPTSPYGSLKLLEEAAAHALDSPQRSSVILRAYSVSGPFVRRPHAYAFSDFVLQAMSGNVAISASHQVFRRYVSAGDAVSVALRSAVEGWSGTIESGGELIEMGRLAERVVEIVNPDAFISRAEPDGLEPETYASDNRSWEGACERLGFVPMNLEDQIRAVAQGLAGSYRSDSRSND